MHTMKTAISVDDDLITEADRTAREMGVSRSRLFSLAIESYLRNREHERILEQLNRVYASESGVVDKRLAARIKGKFRSTIQENW
jgi:metal-responsive CopG/Arc/MetJ family transcriptional regulator